MQVGRADTGEALFLRPVDVRSLDLDAIVDIEKGKILLYPEASGPHLAEGQHASSSVGVSDTADSNGGLSLRSRGRRASGAASAPATGEGPAVPVSAAPPVKPARGEGLNVLAMLTFRRMVVKQKDDAAEVARCSACSALPVLQRGACGQDRADLLV